MAKAIPEGWPSVRPYLHVDGAAEAIDYYEKAFEDLTPDEIADRAKAAASSG